MASSGATEELRGLMVEARAGFDREFVRKVSYLDVHGFPSWMSPHGGSTCGTVTSSEENERQDFLSRYPTWFEASPGRFVHLSTGTRDVLGVAHEAMHSRGELVVVRACGVQTMVHARCVVKFDVTMAPIWIWYNCTAPGNIATNSAEIGGEMMKHKMVKSIEIVHTPNPTDPFADHPRTV
jgi:hypothetical protein